MHTVYVSKLYEVQCLLVKSLFFFNQNNQPVHVFTHDKENGSVCPVYGLKGTGAK